MLLELLAFLLLGVASGTITGLIPGIHINLIAVTFLTTTPFLHQINATAAIIFITTMAITHTFIDFIPSIFLGAPDEETVLSTLPGHRFLIKGYGHTAVQLTLLGSLISIALLIIIIPLFILIIPKIYPFIQRMMAFFLIWISVFLIVNEKKSKIPTIIIFFLAGFLGIASLNLDFPQQLLPLLTGLFGSSTLIYSIRTKTSVPKQKIERIKITKNDIAKPTLITALVSPICSFFPGLGSSQAAIIGSTISKKLNREQFMILLGSINTLVMAISFTTLFLIQKSRTGAANAISQITNLSINELGIIIITTIFTAILIIPITLSLSKFAARNIHKVSYTKISLVILILLTIIIIKISGLLGLLVFTISTILGLTCIEFRVRKGFLMGALLIPTILFYLPF